MKIRITFKRAYLENGSLLTDIIDPNRVSKSINIDGASVSSMIDPDDSEVLLINHDQEIYEPSSMFIDASYSGGEAEFDETEFDATEFLTVASTAYTVDYSNSFELFGYDLGNNRNIFGNPAFEIVFCTTYPDPSLIGTDDYDFSLTNNLISYRKPFTDNIYVYNGLAFNTTYSTSVFTVERSIVNFDDNTIVYGTDNAVVTTSALLDIAQIINVSQQVYNTTTRTTSTSIVASSTSDDFNIIAVEPHFPTFSPGFTSNTNCEDCETSIVSSNTAYAFIDYSILKKYNIDDVENYPYLDDVICYQLIDIAGNILEEKVVDSIVVNNPGSTPPNLPVYDANSETNSFTFSIPSLGDYYVRVVLKSRVSPLEAEFDGDEFDSSEFFTETTESIFENNEIRVCEETIHIFNCNWYSIDKSNCNEYTVKNMATEDVTFIHQSYDVSSKNFTDITTYTIAPYETQTITITTDGVYNFKLSRSEDEETYSNLIISSCNIEDCLAEKISDFLCDDPCCEDCKEQEIFELNRIALTAYAYFSKLHDEYNFSFFYTSLDQSKLDELYDISDQITRLETYCNGCSSTTNSSNCGC